LNPTVQPQPSHKGQTQTQPGLPNLTQPNPQNQTPTSNPDLQSLANPYTHAALACYLALTRAPAAQARCCLTNAHGAERAELRSRAGASRADGGSDRGGGSTGGDGPGDDGVGGGGEDAGGAFPETGNVSISFRANPRRTDRHSHHAVHPDH
jgi:hypothetical protein